MSYEYKNINPTTLQQLKQQPTIIQTTHQILSIQQIAELKAQTVKIYHIIEYNNLMQNKDKQQDKQQDKYNDLLYQISKICVQYKKICLVPHNRYLEQYLSIDREYKNTLRIYIDNASRQYTIPEFFYQYRQLSKLYNLPLVIWSEDLLILNIKQDFNILISQYKKSVKYIESIVLNDFLSDHTIVAPFDGQLFSLQNIHQSIKLFYYILKQNKTFIINFDDKQQLFENIITQYKQLNIDLLPKIYDIFNLILSDLYTNTSIIRLIKADNISELQNEDVDTINSFKTSQALLSFLSNKFNQQTDISLMLYSKQWFQTNVPNEIVRHLIAVQIPAINAYNKLIQSKINQSNELYILLLYKYLIPFEQLRHYYKQGFPYMQRVLIEHQEELYTIAQVQPCIDHISQILNIKGKLSINLQVTGQLIRQLKRNISQLEFIVSSIELEKIKAYLIDIQDPSITFIQVKYRFAFKITIKNIQIMVIIHSYDTNNKGYIQLRSSSTFPFWYTFAKYLKRELIYIQGNQVMQDKKIISVQTEKQLFQLAKIKYVQPENRISYQISDLYVK